jgi:hypothetical protein
VLTTAAANYEDAHRNPRSLERGYEVVDRDGHERLVLRRPARSELE